MIYIRNDMPTIRALFHFFDWVAGLFLGLTIIDMLSLFQDKLVDFSEIKNPSLQYIYILVGLGYFILNGYNNYQAKKLEREHKRLENEKLKEEIEMQSFENEEKKSENHELR